MQTAVIVFPASNCDRDAAVARGRPPRHPPPKVWPRANTQPAPVRCGVVPGGFSYGDYLRSGAMAANSPIVRDLK